MSSLNAFHAQLTEADRQLLRSWLDEFDRFWVPDLLVPQVEQLPAADHPLRKPALAGMVQIDLRHRWRQGERTLIEHYLEVFPELGTAETVPADLVIAEYTARQRTGAAVPWDEYASRFPGRLDELQDLAAQLTPPSPDAPPDADDVSDPTLDKTSHVPEEGSAADGTPSVSTDSDLLPRTLHEEEPDADAGRGIPEQFGRYRIIRALGQGGMGAVYLAHDAQLDRQVALKVPQLQKAKPNAVTRFYREARAVSRVDHPYICPIYDVGQIDGIHYLTMAYIEGQSLAALLRAVQVLDPRSTASLLRKIALAMEEAHQKGVVHRDLKPSNIMINKRGEPVIMDFGLALQPDQDDVRITQSGAALGTPAYMSPEQVQADAQAMGPGCDIYSLGVILYQMLAGRLPFRGPIGAVLTQIIEQEPPPPSSVRPEVDPRLEATCLKAMAKRVEDRHPSMGEVARELTEFLVGGEWQAPAAPAPEAAAEPQSDPEAWLGAELADGRFEIVARLDHGGLAVVYQAHDRQHEAEVIIKAPRTALLHDAGLAQRFVDAAHAMAQLPHPHIAALLEVGQHEGVPYVVLPLLRGGSLADRLAAFARQPLRAQLEELSGWLGGVAEALDFMHGQGHVHREVKPAHVLFDDQGQAYLSDLVLSAALAPGEDKQTAALLASLCTPQYLAPELSMGQAHDGRADQYALAVMLYQLFSGEPPFDGPTSGAIVVKQTTEPPPFLQELVPEMPAALSGAVQRGLARQPDDRFASCVELAQAVLETAVEVSAEPEQPQETPVAALPEPEDYDEPASAPPEPEAPPSVPEPEPVESSPEVYAPPESDEPVFDPVPAPVALGRPIDSLPPPAEPPIDIHTSGPLLLEQQLSRYACPACGQVFPVAASAWGKPWQCLACLQVRRLPPTPPDPATVSSAPPLPAAPIDPLASQPTMRMRVQPTVRPTMMMPVLPTPVPAPPPVHRSRPRRWPLVVGLLAMAVGGLLALEWRETGSLRAFPAGVKAFVQRQLGR